MPRWIIQPVEQCHAPYELFEDIGRYRAMSIPDRVNAAFFNLHQVDSITCTPDEIVLARMMITLDLEFQKAMHYHKGYESDNDYVLPAQVMMPVHIYSVSRTEACFKLANYKEAQHTIYPSHPDDPEVCPSMKGSAGAWHSMKHAYPCLR